MDIRFNQWISAALYVVLAVLLGFSAMLIWPVYQKYVKAQQEVAQLEDQLERARSECLILNQEVHDLEHYASAVEKVAREKFKLCKEGEEVFIYNR